MKLSKLFGVLILIGAGYAATDNSEYEGKTSDFLKMTGSESYDPGSMYKIVDPTYDQTFKAIFVGEEKVNEFTPNQRLISLLNGLLYPETDDDPYAFKIRDIGPLNSEITSIGLSDSSGVLRFDIAFTCYCYSLEGARTTKAAPKVFYIEMQKTKDAAMSSRLQKCASALKRKYGYEVQVVAFIGYTTEESKNESIAIVPYIVSDLNGTPIRPREHYTDVRAIDLRFCSDCLKENKKYTYKVKKARENRKRMAQTVKHKSMANAV